jgi:N utilization substance protein A
MKGARVQQIVNELQGEKIDIVRWSNDLETFAKSALAPAEITSISMNNSEHILDVIVEDDQLSLAIGRRGQNVRLAAMLTGWKVNIISKSKLQERVKLAVENLTQLDTIGESVAQMLVQNGIMSIVDLSATTAEEVERVIRCSSADAQKYIDSALQAVEAAEIKIDIEESEEIISASAIPGRGGFISDGPVRTDTEGGDHQKFSEAERRLREELAAFKLK